jgi:hypothetical protein
MIMQQLKVQEEEAEEQAAGCGGGAWQRRDCWRYVREEEVEVEVMTG